MRVLLRPAERKITRSKEAITLPGLYPHSEMRRSQKLGKKLGPKKGVNKPRKVLIEISSNLFHEMIDFHQLSDPHRALFRFLLEVSKILFGTF